MELDPDHERQDESGPGGTRTRSSVSRTQFPIRGLLSLVIAIVLSIVILFPGGLVIGQPPPTSMISECSDEILEATPALVVLASEGQITFACEFEPLLVPAFTVSGTNVKARPHLTDFESPYQSLWIYRADRPSDAPNTGPCHERGGPARQLHDGERLTIPGDKDWNYCAEYLNVGPSGLPGFQVTWDTA